MEHTPPLAGTLYAPPKRIEYLDSIRGLAALFVLLSPCASAFTWPKQLNAWTSIPGVNLFFDGRSAVTMFFVLSGYVLAHPYLEPAKDAAAPRRLFIPTFYIRRVTRIWLPWFFAFVVSELFREHFWKNYAVTPALSDWLGQFWHAPMTLSSSAKQCVFVLHDAKQLLLPQDWSLGVELRGSALIPLFILVARRSPGALILLLVLCLIGIPNGHYYASFCLGVLTAKLHWPMKGWLQSLSPLTKGAMMVAGLMLYQNRLAFAPPLTQTLEKMVWMTASVGCVLVLAACASSRSMQRVLTAPVLAFLGKVSFSVYLLQFIVLLTILPPFVSAMNSVGVRSPMALFALVLTVGTLATMALATLMYAYVERPSIAVGRWMTKAIQLRTARETAKAQGG